MNDELYLVKMSRVLKLVLLFITAVYTDEVPTWVLVTVEDEIHKSSFDL